MAKILGFNVTLVGLFQLPDIFVNKGNFSHNEPGLNTALSEIKQKVYEGRLKALYEHQSQLPIAFEYFKGPRRLPNEREGNKFWKGLLDYGVWAPLFYESSDNLKFELVSYTDADVKPFFEKLVLSDKSPIRIFIRVFPLGGYSIHMVFNFTIPNNLEYFTIGDLQTIVEDLFDSVKFKLKTQSDVTESDKTISEIFEFFGSMIRDKFLINPNQMYLGMTKHAIINIDRCDGDWIRENIADLGGGRIAKLGIVPEDLTQKDDNSTIVKDVYYSGEVCTLLYVPTSTKKMVKYLKNQTIDVAEFVHLRKLIIEEYTKYISETNIKIAGKIDDLNYINALINKLTRKKITWINERFIANIQTLIELDKKIPSSIFRETIVSTMLEIIGYKETLEELKKELERTQKYAEKYNSELSKRLKVIVNAIEKAIKVIKPSIG